MCRCSLFEKKTKELSLKFHCKTISLLQQINEGLVMKTLMLLFTCMLACSCHSQKKAETQEEFRVDSILAMGGTKKFYMDDGDNLSLGHIRYDEANGKAFLIWGNEREKAISVYDFKSGKKLSEETFFAINMEAAKEIAAQIRLRNLSGIILVDFINLNNPENKESLKEAERVLRK